MTDFKTVFRKYYVLAKPGIIYSNVFAAAAGYLYGSGWEIVPSVGLGLLAGLFLLIGGACAYNNYFDRKLDKVMKRTSTRGLVTGSIKNWQALVFATVLSVSGLALLFATQNTVTFWLTVIAFVDYVFFYTFGKRYTVHGTLIGTISGSLPLVAGYTATAGELNTTAVLLFILMAAWQMVHFYGIALFRLNDYKSAKVPVMPAVRGEVATKRHMIFYIVLFIITGAALMIIDALTEVTGILLIALGIFWLVRSLRTYTILTPEVWGKKTFLFSLIVLLGMSAILIVDPLLKK